MKYASLLAVLLIAQIAAANAQSGATVQSSCAAHLNTSPGESVTLGALLNCLAEMQRTIDGLRQQVTDLSQRPPAESDSDAPAAVPPGAVVAFDGFNGCPEGWSLYTPATARMIVGAGEEFHPKHAEWFMTLPSGGEQRHSLPSYQPESSGGELEHMLTVEEMPKHNHKSGPNLEFDSIVLSDGDGIAPLDTRNDPSSGQINLKRRGTLADAGSSQPHNTMPPYIALYFCQKEG